MTNNRIASVYAKSLLDIAQEQGNTAAILSDVQYLSELVSKSRDFQLMLQSPIIKADKKKTVIRMITEANVNPVTTLFLDLLVSKGREGALLEITKSFVHQYNELNRIKSVRVTTATPMNDDIRKVVSEKAKSLAPGSEIQIEEIVDEEIIGGYIIEIGDTRYDASVKHQLNAVRKEFSKNIAVQL